MSPLLLVLPLALLQLQLSFAVCTVETGQSGASSGRLIAADSPSSSSFRWAAVSAFGFSRSCGGFCFFFVSLAVDLSTSYTVPLISAVPPMTVRVMSLAHTPPSPLPRSTLSSASLAVPTHAARPALFPEAPSVPAAAAAVAAPASVVNASPTNQRARRVIKKR